MAAEQLKDYASALYDRLRALARARMLGQRAGHTLDPTGLAHEAIMRLLKCDPGQINDEEHFMTLAVEAMRQILVDHARAKAAIKRGGGQRPASLEEDDAAGQGMRSNRHLRILWRATSISPTCPSIHLAFIASRLCSSTR